MSKLFFLKHREKCPETWFNGRIASIPPSPFLDYTRLWICDGISRQHQYPIRSNTIYMSN